MDTVQSSDGIYNLRFRIKENWTEISFGTIGSLLGFPANAPESIDIDQITLESFWLQFANGTPKERMRIVNPIIRIIHRYMTVRVLERIDDTKVQNAELKWLYIALVQPTWTNSNNAMINHWIVQRNRTTGLLGFGHYLTIIAASLRPDLVFSPNYAMKPANIDENSLRKGKYIYGNSSSGFFVAKTKFRIPSSRLALFAQNRIDWLERFMFEEGESSQQSPSGWGAWETPQTHKGQCIMQDQLALMILPLLRYFSHQPVFLSMQHSFQEEQDCIPRDSLQLKMHLNVLCMG